MHGSQLRNHERDRRIDAVRCRTTPNALGHEDALNRTAVFVVSIVRDRIIRLLSPYRGTRYLLIVMTHGRRVIDTNRAVPNVDRQFMAIGAEDDLSIAGTFGGTLWAQATQYQHLLTNVGVDQEHDAIVPDGG